MTTTTYPTTAASSFQVSTITQIVAYISRFAEGVREGQEIHGRYRKLSQLSRAELARCGLDRQSIARAALNSR
ncbi:MAG TPA: hypothetical protein VFX37_03240 [Pseudolabrys sp.]|nr:hypothetical protein [Pseudolabrys sp.]